MAYTPLTDAEIKAQAETEFQSYYDKLRLSSQQNVATTDLLLQQQIGGLDTTYGKQLDTSQRDYAQTYSQASRAQLSRGMGRSSYALQTLANVSAEGSEARQTILDAKAASQANLEAQRTQLQSQLAAQIMNYDASQSADILKRISELQQNEYTKQYQSERDAIADAQWQAELNEKIRQFNESLAASQSSGGGGTKKTVVTAPTTTGMTLDQLIASLSGGSSGASGTGAGTSLKAGSTAGKTYSGLSLFANATPTTTVKKSTASSSFVDKKLLK